VDELAARRREVTGPRSARVRPSFTTVFDVQPDCPADDLAEAARTSVALDRLVADHRLGSLAYYYKGTGVPRTRPPSLHHPRHLAAHRARRARWPASTR
jgi:L-arabinose isomerase